MSFRKRLLKARKKKCISQEELADNLKTRRPVIGRYERHGMKPSIEGTTNMADILGVSLDWLVGHTYLELDKDMILRIQEVRKTSTKDKEHVFAMPDALQRYHKHAGISKKGLSL